MKSILISIKPKMVEKILNGEKTIEIRKKIPKCELPIDVYIYCCKNGKRRLLDILKPHEKNDYFGDNDSDKTKIIAYNEDNYFYFKNGPDIINGKVVAKFTLNRISYLSNETIQIENEYLNHYGEELEKTCLTWEELQQYAEGKNIYVWRIDNLVIFDEPKELKEFYQKNPKCRKENCYYYMSNYTCGNKEYAKENCYYKAILTKAPKNWCYVEAKE